MLVDVFLWNGETDMGDLRVQTLAGHVDLMVAVSCDLTHQSDPVTAFPPPDGCEWHTVHAQPIPEGRGGVGNRWYQWIERQHRDGMRAALTSIPSDAVVLVSDVDEIPDPSTLDDIEAVATRQPVAVPMRMHGFALDYLYPKTWVGTTASTAALCAPQAHRNWRHRLPRAGSGWHLSWMGSLEERQRKLASFSHAELATLDVDACWRDGIHANGEPLARIDVDAHDWPPPMFDTFIPPPDWRAPQMVA